MNNQSVIDGALIASELMARQIYWRIPFIEKASKTINKKQVSGVDYERYAIINCLQKIGVKKGSLIMVHSSIRGISSKNHLKVANQILKDILNLVGKEGTVVMPTHPYYKDDPGFMNDKSDLLLTYDPDKLPARVGLLNELFRRQSNTKRSMHPLSSQSATGPLADELLMNNLNNNKPLPHGIYSGYHRFCKFNGIVISLGVPLANRMTIFHVAEEIRDEEWPIKNFFYERRFIIPKAGDNRVWIVRERRPEYVRSLARLKRRRDLLREGILHESVVSGVRVDWANAGDVLSFMLHKNQNSTYPYYFPKLSENF